MTILDVVESLGILSFALSGAISAIRKRLDVFGVLIITFVTSIGGGTIRDMLIGSTPVAWLLDVQTIAIITLGYFIALFFFRYVIYLRHTIFWLDTVGLALFCTIAVQKGLNFHLSFPACVAVGTISGCFGGIIRDVLLNEIPYIFRKDIYASACMAGAVSYLLLNKIGLESPWPEIVCSAIIIGTRFGAVYLKWRLPLIYMKE